MKKLLVVFAAFLLVVSSANADRRSKSQILNAAARALTEQPANYSGLDMKSSIKVLNDSYSQLSIVGIENGPFVIVSNDDTFSEIIGISDSNAHYDVQNLAPGFLWLMDLNNKNMEDALKEGRTIPEITVNPAFKEEVPHMLTCQWNQTEPFNDETPTYGNSEHYLTGCAATAMSQIMYYYKYPEIGRGRISYKFDVNGKSQRVVKKFDSESFMWDDMIDVYVKGRYSVDQAYSVAQLMANTGASVKMRYAPGGSSAYSDDVATALYTYFDYSYATECYHRDWMTQPEWEDLVYGSLSDGAPVFIGAQSSIGGQDAGHAFVIDGYNKKGLVYVNFGWGGDSNGFYALMNMHGYDHAFEMISVRKPSDSYKRKSYWSLYDGIDLNPSSNTISGTVINSSIHLFTGVVSTLLMNVADETIYELSRTPYRDIDKIKNGVQYNFFDFTQKLKFPEDLPDGEYRLFLASKGNWEILKDPTDKYSETYREEEGKWQPLRADDKHTNCYIVTVKDGQRSYKKADENIWYTGVENVTVENINKSDKVEVFDVMGRKVYTSAASEFKLSDVPAQGLLIIKEGDNVRKIMK